MVPSAGVRLLVLTCCLAICLPDAAYADVTTLDGSGAPVVRINVRHGDVTVRTWDRPTIAIDGDSTLRVERKPGRLDALSAPILIPQSVAATAAGQIALAPESFVVTIPPGRHQQIIVRSPRGDASLAGPLTVTVPSATALLVVHTGDGNVDVRGYQGGTLVGFVGRGRLTLEGVTGTAFVQTGHGALAAFDSSFERLRARSLFGNLTFERCHARQIEATTVNGSIVYDGGSFEPGLARFESTRGDIAIGTVGSAEVGAHAAGQGKIYTSFGRDARVEGRDGETSAVVGAGGPVVTAASQSGDIFLYDGSLRAHGPALGPRWQAPLDVLEGRPVPRDERPPGADPQRGWSADSYRRRTPHGETPSPWSRFKLKPSEPHAPTALTRR